MEGKMEQNEITSRRFKTDAPSDLRVNWEEMLEEIREAW